MCVFLYIMIFTFRFIYDWPSNPVPRNERLQTSSTHRFLLGPPRCTCRKVLDVSESV